jgi:hypothetical protein
LEVLSCLGESAADIRIYLETVSRWPQPQLAAAPPLPQPLQPLPVPMDMDLAPLQIVPAAAPARRLLVDKPTTSHEIVEYVANLNPEELRFTLRETMGQLLSVQSECNDLKSDLRTSERSRKHFKQRCTTLEHQIVLKQDSIDTMNEQVNFRAKGCKRKISIVGGYNLARKHAFGHASASALVQAVAGDAINGGLRDRNVVAKFEHRRKP